MFEEQDTEQNMMTLQITRTMNCNRYFKFGLEAMENSYFGGMNTKFVNAEFHSCLSSL